MFEFDLLYNVKVMFKLDVGVVMGWSVLDFVLWFVLLFDVVLCCYFGVDCVYMGFGGMILLMNVL